MSIFEWVYDVGHCRVKVKVQVTFRVDGKTKMTYSNLACTRNRSTEGAQKLLVNLHYNDSIKY